MKTFIAIYLGSAAGMAEWKKMDEATRKRQEKAGMEAWKNWASANQKVTLDAGGPLGKTKRISKQGISDTRNELTGYTIINAESHDAAAKLFENHPHFMIFPGDAVEVVEVLPMPQM